MLLYYFISKMIDCKRITMVIKMMMMVVVKEEGEDEKSTLTLSTVG